MSLKNNCSWRFLVPVEITTRLPERMAGNIFHVGTATGKFQAVMVPTTRGSSGGRKPTSGIRSKLASSCVPPYACTNELIDALKPFSQTAVWICSRSARHRVPSVQEASGPAT